MTSAIVLWKMTGLGRQVHPSARKSRNSTSRAFYIFLQAIVLTFVAVLSILNVSAEDTSTAGQWPATAVTTAEPPTEQWSSASEGTALQQMLSPDCNYWIVSSWNAPQMFSTSPRKFIPEVTQYEAGRGYQKKSISDLKSSLIPGVPVCVVVHGSFMDSPSVRPESLSTWKWLKQVGQPFQMIYFSWPSDRPITLAQIDIAILGNRASHNGFYLASLLHDLPPECPVSLLGHSHGTRVISSSLHLMSGGEVEGISHPRARCTGKRIRCVFIASAIDHDWLCPDEHFGRALCCTECLLNLTNKQDPALVIYPFRRLGSARALGCVGFTERDSQDLAGWSRKVQNLDVSDEIGVAHMWPNYINQRQLPHRLQNYLFFSDSLTPNKVVISTSSADLSFQRLQSECP